MTLPPTSTFTWLDYADSDRRQAMDFLSKLGDKSTVDQLGIGTVRDALADILFPGTSTIQTRARYFLFVPWVYRLLEEKRVPADKAEARARDWEIKLILYLAESEDQRGLIGKQSLKGLRRLPSDIYWAGLATWGVRQFAGSQRQFFQDLQRRIEQRRVMQHHRELGEEMGLGAAGAWHGGLPDAPKGFPDIDPELSLSMEEAHYLQERLFTAPLVAESLLSAIVRRGESIDAADKPWLLSYITEFSEVHQQQLFHAQCFSLVMNGAQLLYEWLMAAKQAREDLDLYYDPLAQWVVELGNHAHQLRIWDRDAFWQLVGGGSHNVTGAKGFVENWLTLLGSFTPDVDQLIKDKAYQRLIVEREYQKKGALARLSNKRALELWDDKPGAAALNYRWNNVQTLVDDILTGLQRDVDA